MKTLLSFIKRRPGVQKFLRNLRFWSSLVGVDVFRMASLGGLPAVVREYAALKRQNKATTQPCIHDRFEESGVASGHYFHQDLLVARRVFARQPERHVDVASRVETFVAHVAAFRPIEVFDVRPLSVRIPNISFRQCDFMNLPADLHEYADSVSCLHALEHFGLGRYGDPIDINGHLKGFDSLYKVLKPGGMLYLSFPVGEVERIDFNAHRVFSIGTVLRWLEGRFELIAFSYVDDRGDLHENIDRAGIDAQRSFGLHYGCGIFELKKL
ncbi:MAG: DUF268 domain-containing protein [Rhodocyclaceae bacterium]